VLLRLQSTVGNRAVGRLLTRSAVLQRAFLDEAGIGEQHRDYLREHDAVVKAINAKVDALLRGAADRTAWLSTLPDPLKLDIVMQSIGDRELTLVATLCAALRAHPHPHPPQDRATIQALLAAPTARTVVGASPDEGIRAIAARGPEGYDAALGALRERYAVGAGLDFDLRHTNDFAAVVRGAPIPGGTPYGVTGVGVHDDTRITVFVHDHWIDEWLVQTNQVGNLLNVCSTRRRTSSSAAPGLVPAT
jgi:hypothetical protein